MPVLGVLGDKIIWNHPEACFRLSAVIQMLQELREDADFSPVQNPGMGPKHGLE
jgi:hypothetical protein